jgi:hypothetical protein
MMRHEKPPFPKFIGYIGLITALFAIVSMISFFILDPIEYAGWLKLLTWILILGSPIIIVIAFWTQAAEVLRESPWKVAVGLLMAGLSALFACGDIFAVLNNELGTPAPYEIALTRFETSRQITNTYSAAIVIERSALTQQSYLANYTKAAGGAGTSAPIMNLALTLAAVETEVMASVVAEIVETVEAYRSTYLTPVATRMPLLDAGTATQKVIMTQITLTRTPTAP